MTLASFKESGSIEYSSNMIIGFNYVNYEYGFKKERFEDYKGVIVAKVLKNGAGCLSEQILKFLGESSYFDSLFFGEESLVKILDKETAAYKKIF